MTQSIVVMIIIAFAIIYSVYAVVKSIRKKETSACGNCNGCDIKREIMRNMNKHPSKAPTVCGYTHK
jgi:hypothetical protein